jgi:hypothetical protein
LIWSSPEAGGDSTDIGGNRRGLVQVVYTEENQR